MNTPTTAAQNRQARGKPTGPEQGRSSKETQESRAKESKGKKRSGLVVVDDETKKTIKTVSELHEEREKRNAAARILESNELLIFHSHANDESIPQTRLRFEKIMAGIASDESEAEWEDDYDDDDSVNETSSNTSKGGAMGESRKRPR
ncbi:MAG: hypothetical protein M1819_002786 [Sarea resinae]|nr:MAG: hypothetical protein M1819_002786 [Sarea resinae]